MLASRSLGTEVTPKLLGSVRVVSSLVGRQIVSLCRGERTLGAFEWFGVSGLASGIVRRGHCCEYGGVYGHEGIGFGRGGRHALEDNGPAQDICEGISQSRGSRDSVHQVQQGRKKLVVRGRSEQNVGVHSGASARVI